MVSNNEVQKMSESLLEYSVTKDPGEGFIATCVINPQISVFSKEDGQLLSDGIKSAAKLYAKLHPTEENISIRDNDFEMKRVE